MHLRMSTLKKNLAISLEKALEGGIIDERDDGNSGIPILFCGGLDLHPKRSGRIIFLKSIINHEESLSQKILISYEKQTQWLYLDWNQSMRSNLFLSE